MTLHHLKITAFDHVMVVERLLQVTRYRGFRLCGLSMLPAQQDNLLDIQLSVESDRSVENLTKQLLKIIDIEQIKVEDQGLQTYPVSEVLN
ncbi:acetolactate synthase 2 small subunit [Thalassotalea mangrovi]|uniref:Acetolactate synthase 2 small subunit n=1 Tax=Thalassotalea mangrovi TaxID=2572245 RepID=A0A4U1B5L0_9GAMM|nr:acetolactate synthase 2 small subunit [Thalassotalea mangrovi]TKB45398.1 acetolactate synthase 2 small subunit [Thalassotalea mangrovi]